MLQRIGLAQAIINEPKLLFLDEPTTFLDIAYQVEILDLLGELNRTKKTTIIMVLHDINQALKYSDEVIGLKDGKIVFAGTPDAVITDESVSDLYDIALAVEEFNNVKVVMPKNSN